MKHQMKLTVPLEETAAILRKAGMRISAAQVANGIECGRYPFGKVISVGPSGRRQTEIFRADLQHWLEGKLSYTPLPNDTACAASQSGC